MVPRSISRTAAFWLTVCATLAAVVAYQLSNSISLAPAVTAAPPAAPPLDAAERPALPRAPDDAAVELVAARPLFSENRRPYVPPPEPVEAPAPQPSQHTLPLELAGTYLTGADQAALLLVAGGTPVWLREGEEIEGWQIDAIGPDRVALSKDDHQQVLQLRNDAAPLPPATGPAYDEADEDEATTQ